MDEVGDGFGGYDGGEFIMVSADEGCFVIIEDGDGVGAVFGEKLFIRLVAEGGVVVG